MKRTLISLCTLSLLFCLLTANLGQISCEEGVATTTTAPLDISKSESSSTDASVTEAKEPEEDEDSDTDDGGSDPWGESEDEGGVNIVDQMRELREKDQFQSVVRNVTHLNDTFNRVRDAWEIIDNYYLPSKQTWEKLLGLVTGLNVQVSPECFSSYFSGVSGFRTYAPWSYRCEFAFKSNMGTH